MILQGARAMLEGYATAARVAVAPYLDVIRLVASLAVVIATVVLVWRIHAWREGYLERDAAVAALKAERACEAGTACAGRAVKAQADGQAAVAAAFRAAQEAARKEQARIAAEGQAAVERAQAAAARATADRLKAEARLRESIATDASCAAQAREPIACDY